MTIPGWWPILILSRFDKDFGRLYRLFALSAHELRGRCILSTAGP